MIDSYSLIGISDEGRKTTLCVHVQPDNEARRIAKTLEQLGDYARVDVVPEGAAAAPTPQPETESVDRPRVVIHKRSKRGR